MLSRIWSVKPFSLDIGLLLVRLTLSGLMIPHGYNKLLNFTAEANTFPDPMGVGHPLSLGLAIFAELFCSILLACGLFTRFALIPLIATMGIAVFIILADDPFGDKEHALLFLIPYVGLFLTGPGTWSLDQFLKK